MYSVSSIERGLLLASVLASSACGDLKDLARIPAAADTAEAVEQPPPSHPAGDSKPGASNSESSFAEIRRSLRRLVAAEEAFFAENGTYSDDFSQIGVNPGPDTKLRFLWISREGWAASGTHADLPGRDCVIFVGRAQAPPTTLRYVRSGREGVPVCDETRTRSPRPRPAAPAPATSNPRPEAGPEPADTVSALDLLDPRVVMKVDLRNLAHSQETYFAMQGSYARRTQTLALQYLWHRDVQVEILAADAQSWAAKATHARFPGRSCVIWFGPVTQRPRTDAQRRVENRAGVPVCDER